VGPKSFRSGLIGRISSSVRSRTVVIAPFILVSFPSSNGCHIYILDNVITLLSRSCHIHRPVARPLKEYLNIVPKFRRLKPCRELRIFKGNKNQQHPSFGGEVKPSAPCRKILRYVKEIIAV
jgi:hypothetical protein